MQIGMIGLGRMGSALVRRLLDDGHECVVHDIDASAAEALVAKGAVAAGDTAELADRLAPPRVVWVMVPAGLVDTVLDGLGPHLDAGDTVVDGGNSNFGDSIARGERLAGSGLHLVDIGTSGGIHGASRGFCLMIGGDDDAVAALEPALATLAPGVEAGVRTGGATGPLRPGEAGWLHCGPTGAGHFVKMVHNGIEYGMMAALAEGLAICANAGLGSVDQRHDAETTPLREPGLYRFDLDLAAVTEVWRRGSVISSWLVDLTAEALAADPSLEGFAGRVADSGEGRWTVEAAVDLGVPAQVITAALYERFASRDRADVANRLLSAMRLGFGGHLERVDGDR